MNQKGIYGADLVNTDFFKQLFNWAGEGMLVVNSKGCMLLANQRILDLFEYTSDELIGQSLQILLPKKTVPRHGGHLNSYFKDPRPRRMSEKEDLKGRKKSGNEFYVDISLNHFKSGDESYAIALVTDITERVLANRKILELNEQLEEKVEERTKELAESQRLYSTIARNFPDGTINVFDSELNYIFAEGKELYKMGITGEQLIGSNFIERLPKEFKKEVSESLAEVFSGVSKTLELNLGENYYALDAVPLYNADDEINRILVVEKNISVAKKAEREMQRSLEREKELNILKSRFVSMASHEFRTPLSTILSSIQLISKYTTTEQQGKRDKHIDRVMSSVNHLNSVLNDFLSLEKLESGKVNTRLSEFSLRELCAEVREDMIPTLKAGQEIKHYCNAEKETILFDEHALKAMLLNLLSNASKYSESGDEIIFNVSYENELLSIFIKDHGIGIPKKEQGHLFERFFRANNVTNIEGTGLGLNIVRSYVKLFNGDINFESEEGKGTAFMLTFPIK